MELVLSPVDVKQPEVYLPATKELHVAIASLSLGGAERIVLDWAERIYPRFRVHLIVLRNREKEWPVPPFVRVTRVGGIHLEERLKLVGKMLAWEQNPVCVCHLLNGKERRALASAGVTVIPVLHNAKSGWAEDPCELIGSPYVIAVSDACAKDLRDEEWKGSIEIIRHIPKVRQYPSNIHEEVRRIWNIPKDAIVIGMLGAVKPQKNYPLALKIFKSFLEKQDAYLVIMGGPVNTSVGLETWKEVVGQVNELGIRNNVAMPGFVPDATRFLPACDVILNTSHYEGLSIATLEALLSDVPVVASKVGGQGEIPHDSLILLSPDEKKEVWVSALEMALHQKVQKPIWADFPSYRLWTLAGLSSDVSYSKKTLFVTANLSSGGAQRSLVNLTKSLVGKLSFEVMVAGKSSIQDFFEELTASGVRVMSAGKKWDVFDYSEVIIDKIVREGFGTVCFWNVDPRIKLLLVKALGFSHVRFVEVSPGAHAFEEMAQTDNFQEFAAFDEKQFLERIDMFVHKWDALPPAGCENKTITIRNGVRECDFPKEDYAIHGAPKVVVSGRIAPSKFLVEIITAMKLLWNRIPDAELHIIGGVERYHQEYFDEILKLAGDDNRIKFYGPQTNVLELLPKFDAYVVLGENQGCPNALLEALSVGLPSIGNDDGGTGEQIIDRETGILLQGTDPAPLAKALENILLARVFAEKVGRSGRKHILRVFSMKQMTDKYEALLSNEK